jgi:hypothetical protein
VFVDDEEVVVALRKTIVKASKDLQKGRKGITADGLARLVSSYCRLKGINRYGGSQAEDDRDPTEHGDPGYYGSLGE